MADGESGLYSEMDHLDGPTHPQPDPEGAPDDQEMPLADHVEEMIRRLAVVLLIMAVASGIVFPFGDRLINFLWNSILPGTDVARPRLYHPLALILARLKVATLAGFIVALPVFVYETYLFMRPGLYPRERRYYLAAVPTSLVLAAIGVLFAFFLVLPGIFTYFLYYSQSAAAIAFGLTETFNLIVIMLGLFALIFQIPLFVMLAVMMGVTTREWLSSRRIYFWGGFLTIAFLFSPDPTGMAPILVAATMIALFDGTLMLLKWTSGDAAVTTAEAVEARRPYAWVAAGLVGYLASAAPVGGYYGLLPGTITDALARSGLVGATPLAIGGGLIALYELVALAARRSAGAPRLRRAIGRARAPLWILAAVLGYLGAPDPSLLRYAGRVALSPADAATVAVGLVALYELVVLALRYRERRA